MEDETSDASYSTHSSDQGMIGVGISPVHVVNGNSEVRNGQFVDRPIAQNALKQENGIAERVINKECALSEKEIELIRKENELRVKEEELRKREETIRRERELLRREKDLRKREDELKRKETELLEIQARKKLKHSDSRRQAVSGNLGSNTSVSESRTVTSPHSEYHSSLPSKLKNSTNNGDALKINSESINVNQGQTTEHEASNEENFDISQFCEVNLSQNEDDSKGRNGQRGGSEGGVAESGDIKDEAEIKSEPSDYLNESDLTSTDVFLGHSVDNNDDEDSEQVRYSDIPGDYSSFGCHICNYTGTYRGLVQHLPRKHSLTLGEYKAIHGEIIFRDKVLHICKICSKEILYTRDHLEAHVRKSHDSNYANNTNSENTKKLVEDYKEDIKIKPILPEDKFGIRYSDVYKDCSVYICQECDYSGFSEAMHYHVKNSHGMNAGQYLGKHGEHLFKDKVRHICKICNQDLLYTNGNLAVHLKAHGTTMEHYVEQYLGADYSGKNKGDDPFDCAVRDLIVQSQSEATDNVESQTKASEMPHSNARYSDEPDDYSTFGCHKCDFSGAYAEFIFHLNKAHKSTYKAYKKLHKDNIIIGKVLHKCKICQQEIVHTSDHLDAHMRMYHDLSRDLYVAACLDMDTLQKFVDSYLDKSEEKSYEAPFRYSEDYKDCAVYICQECGYSGFYATLHLHVKREHKMNAAQYLAKHGKYVFKDKVKHRCKICGHEFLYRYHDLKFHLKSSHKITPDQYGEQYLDKVPAPEKKPRKRTSKALTKSIKEEDHVIKEEPIMDEDQY